MSHQETTVTVYARDTFDRSTLFLDGVTGAEDAYGKVEIVRLTKVKTVTDGDRYRVLDQQDTEEVLLVLDDPNEVTHLIKTLSTALVGSLRVKPPYRATR